MLLSNLPGAQSHKPRRGNTSPDNEDRSGTCPAEEPWAAAELTQQGPFQKQGGPMTRAGPTLPNFMKKWTGSKALWSAMPWTTVVMACTVSSRKAGLVRTVWEAAAWEELRHNLEHLSASSPECPPHLNFLLTSPRSQLPWLSAPSSSPGPMLTFLCLE